MFKFMMKISKLHYYLWHNLKSSSTNLLWVEVFWNFVIFDDDKDLFSFSFQGACTLFCRIATKCSLELVCLRFQGIVGNKWLSYWDILPVMHDWSLHIHTHPNRYANAYKCLHYQVNKLIIH